MSRCTRLPAGSAGCVFLASVAAALPLSDANAGHPLITEDAYTLGEGVTQLEIGFEHARFDQPQTEGWTNQLRPVLSHGVLDTLDVVVGIPILDTRELTAVGIQRTRGIGDASLEAKWRFWEDDLAKVALKPGLTFPSGSFRKGEGTGGVDPSVYLVSTFERGDWVWNVHVGYLRNDNRGGERRDLLHLSGSVVYRLGPRTQCALDVAADSDVERDRPGYPAVALAAVVYSPTERIDLDAGVKVGLNGLADTYGILAGATFRW